MDEENRLAPAQVAHALTKGETRALAPVAIDELTTKVMFALDVIAAIIPDLRTPHPATAKKVRGARTVSREAVLSIIAMVEASPALRDQDILDTARAHEVLEYDDGFRVLDERLMRLREQVRYTVEARWAEVVGDAMAVYYIASRLARDPRHADLAQHVATIRRHLGRRNTKKDKDPKPE